MFKKYNPNPYHQRTGDCVVRALSKALHQSWDKTYVELAIEGYLMGAMPSESEVWGAYLRNKGYDRYIISNSCPNCYSVIDFCYDHPYGTYVVGSESHAITIIDGNYYDSWDSGDEPVIFYWRK